MLAFLDSPWDLRFFRKEGGLVICSAFHPCVCAFCEAEQIVPDLPRSVTEVVGQYYLVVRIIIS